jgi:hypothetical protein
MSVHGVGRVYRGEVCVYKHLYGRIRREKDERGEYVRKVC